MPWLHRQTDEHVCVTLSELPVAMEVEVPGPITIHVVTIPDCDVMFAQPRKRDPERHSHALIDEHVIPVR